MERKRGRRPTWGINRGPSATTQSLAIDFHYRVLELNRIWTTDRFVRLCGFLGATKGELASLCGIQHTELKRYLERGSFPQPVCLLLTLLENFAMGDINPDPIEGQIVPTNILSGGKADG